MTSKHNITGRCLMLKSLLADNLSLETDRRVMFGKSHCRWYKIDTETIMELGYTIYGESLEYDLIQRICELEQISSISSI